MTVVLFGISACGNNASETFQAETESTEEPETVSEEETETTEEVKEESTAKKEEDKEEESKKEETKKSDTEDKSDTKKESESKEESKAESTPKATDTKESTANNNSKTAESTSTPAPTTAPTPTPAHEHSYTSSVTQNPTCSSQGVRSYVCSCGASYTESIPSTEHNWVEKLNTINHEAQGEWRNVLVSEGSGDVYICNYCGDQSSSSEANVNHCASYVGIDNNHARATYTIRSAEPVYSQEWVEISPAWSETVVIGYQCSVCGATK